MTTASKNKKFRAFPARHIFGNIYTKALTLLVIAVCTRLTTPAMPPRIGIAPTFWTHPDETVPRFTALCSLFSLSICCFVIFITLSSNSLYDFQSSKKLTFVHYHHISILRIFATRIFTNFLPMYSHTSLIWKAQLPSILKLTRKKTVKNIADDLPIKQFFPRLHTKTFFVCAALFVFYAAL